VARSNIGITKANLYYINNTAQKITGMQFRIWYDRIAFGGDAPTVALKYNAADQYMQYATNTTEGNITVTSITTSTLTSGGTLNYYLITPGYAGSVAY
jgi:hypothetical protein